MFHYGAQAFVRTASEADEVVHRAMLMVEILSQTRSRQPSSVARADLADVIMLDGGRIGPVVDGERVGLRLWQPGDHTGEMVVWIDGGAFEPAEIVARCLLAVDGPLAGRSDGDEWHCTLAEVTRLTGLSDDQFAHAARTTPRIGRAAHH